MNQSQTPTQPVTDRIDREDVLAALVHHIGRGRGTSAHKLVTEIRGHWTARAERDMRRVVEALRNEGVAIVATPGDGYYIARDIDELNRTISFLRQRALCSLSQIRSLKKLALPGLAGQRRFTQ